MVTSTIRVKRLARAFDASDPNKKTMHVQMARLCVLYEDLRIEYVAARQDRLEVLDITDIETRRFYFVRRSLGTLAEIAQAINKLNGPRWTLENRPLIDTAKAAITVGQSRPDY